MTDHYLGIDIGTTHVKAALIDASTLRVTAAAHREIPLLTPQPTHAEQNPDDWWNLTIAAVREALTATDSTTVRGIGLSGQMHGTVCIDPSGQPVRPAIIWADQRADEELRLLRYRLGRSIQSISDYAPGWYASGFMALSLMWLHQMEPDTITRTHAAILPKDFVRMRLTNTIATDISDASGTWLYDVHNRCWSDWLIDLCRIDRRLLPTVLPSSALVGTLTESAAAALGLPAGLPVSTGAADLAAQALGCGVTDPGDCLIVMGTGGQVMTPLDRPISEGTKGIYLYNHAVPDRWYLQSSILAAGLGLRWLRDVLGDVSYADLTTLAQQVPSGSDGLLFIPHLAGDRSFETAVSGGFAGLRLHHKRPHLARAVMEGVAFAMRTCVDAIRHERENTPLRFLISGGVIKSSVWAQIMADVVEEPLHILSSDHHACIGAAITAALATGHFASISQVRAMLPPPTSTIQPNPDSYSVYRETFLHFAEHYYPS